MTPDKIGLKLNCFGGVIKSNFTYLFIPSKVFVFVWRLLRDRLLTKNNLVRRRVIQATDTTCTAACGDLETTNHLFLGCDIYSSIWLLVLHWLNISSVLSGELRHHFFAVYTHGWFAYRFSYLFFTDYLVCICLGDLKEKEQSCLQQCGFKSFCSPKKS